MIEGKLTRRELVKKLMLGGAVLTLGSQLPIPKIVGSPSPPVGVEIHPDWIHLPPLEADPETATWGADEKGRMWMVDNPRYWDGAQIKDAGGNPDEIADAVWDEAKSGHVTSETFGKIVQDVQTRIGVPDVSLKGDHDDIKGSGFTGGVDDLKTIRANAQSGYGDVVARLNRKVSMMTFWSDVDDVIDLPATAADTSLPNVVVEGLPSGVTLIRIVVIIKIRVIENTSASGANAIQGAQNIRVKKSTGTWGVDDVAAINLADNMWTVAASTREGGDVVVGDNDVKSEVDGNATYNLRFEDADVDYDYLRLNDVQVGIQVWFY